MSQGVNKVILIGHLGAVPVVRQTQNETRVANFSLAVNQEWKDREGSKQERVDWFQCVCWNGLAGVVEKYLTKGSKVYIEGRIQVRSYEHPESGEQRVVHEIVVSELRMLSPAPEETSAGQPRGQKPGGRPVSTPPAQKTAQGRDRR